MGAQTAGGGGTIPTELGLLTALVELKISGNNYIGGCLLCYFGEAPLLSRGGSCRNQFAFSHVGPHRDYSLGAWQAVQALEATLEFEHAHGEAAIRAGAV